MLDQIYSRYIFQLLMEYGKVTLPSFGTFSIETSKSFFMENRTKLYPPESKLFYSKAEDSSYLFDKLLIASGMMQKDAVMFSKLFEVEYSDTKLKGGNFILHGFGELVNGKFIVSDQKVFNSFEGLEPIDIKILPKKFAPLVAGVTAGMDKKQTIHKSSGQWIWYIVYAALLLLLSIAIFNWWTGKSKYVIKNQDNTSVAIAVESSDSKFKMETPKDNFENSASADSEVNSEIIPTETVSTSKPNLSNVYQEDDSCVIIVGSFKVASNAEKMILLAQQKGYKVFQQESNGFKRVGVTIACESANPEPAKHKVRGVFGNEAWYLDDTLR